MRKTLAVVALTTALTGAPAVAAYADAPVAAPPVTQSNTENDDQEQSDKLGLWGLLGLLGLAGLAKKKERTETHTTTRR